VNSESKILYNKDTQTRKRKLSIIFENCKIDKKFEEQCSQYSEQLNIIEKISGCESKNIFMICNTFLKEINSVVDICKVNQALLSGMTLTDINAIYHKNKKIYCEEEIIKKCMDEIFEKTMLNIDKRINVCEEFINKKEKEYKDKEIEKLRDRIEADQKRLVELENV